MELRQKKRLGDMLVESKVISQSQLMKALEKQKGSGKKLGEVLVSESITTEDAIAKALSDQLGLEMVDVSNAAVKDDIIALFNQNLLKKNICFPFEYKDASATVLRVAMADPMDMYAQDDISIVAGCKVEVAVATTRSIMLAIDKYYGQNEVDEALEQYAKEKNFLKEDETLAAEDVNSSPIVILVKEMIDSAVRQRASDIHIEALERSVRIRYRIDGALYEKKNYPVSYLPATAARIKIIGGMDIAERRKPQDGRITQIVDRMEYDIRVSVLPTVYGEKIVMRLTSKTGLTKAKSQLGLNEKELKDFDYILSHPHGILLVTGPTGSGKSTTLYTALSELNREDVNIITVEDPVEANINGINQVQVNPKAELTFASSLRSILRQDPDIIMIGEIRDQETASIAVQASITGHLVVSTLHTNSSASTITRLADMGIEPYLLADSIIGVIAQRLVRRLCSECKRRVAATQEQKEQLCLTPEQMEQNIMIYEPCGCPACDKTGYKGRIGVYEIMKMSPKLKHIISNGGDAEKIKDQALSEGMNTLHMSAARYVLDGITSFSEMVKVSFDV